MYCILFVTVCKKKIPHKGRYYTNGNIVKKKKLFFSCRSVDETKTSTQAVTHIPT